MGRRGTAVALIAVGLFACTSTPPASKQPATEPAPSETDEPVAKGATPDPPEPAPPPEPPELHLQVLEERLFLGLAIQNRSDSPQRVSSEAALVGEGASRLELELSADRDCLVLRPGSEWLWPADWGETLAPQNAVLEGLDGRYHFELRGCEGGEPLRSASVSLPLRYR